MRAASCTCELRRSGQGTADVDSSGCSAHRQLSAARVALLPVDGVRLVALAEYCPA